MIMYHYKNFVKLLYKQIWLSHWRLRFALDNWTHHPNGCLLVCLGHWLCNEIVCKKGQNVVIAVITGKREVLSPTQKVWCTGHSHTFKITKYHCMKSYDDDTIIESISTLLCLGCKAALSCNLLLCWCVHLHGWGRGLALLLGHLQVHLQHQPTFMTWSWVQGHWHGWWVFALSVLVTKHHLC